MKTFKPTDRFAISLTLPDGETDKGIKAFIYTLDGVNVTPIINGNQFIPLVHVANGLYMNTGTNFTMPVGNYVVQAIVYNNVNYDTLDVDYGATDDDVVVTSEGANLEQVILDIRDTLKMLIGTDIEVEFNAQDDTLLDVEITAN